MSYVLVILQARSCRLIKYTTPLQIFSCDFCEFFQIYYSTGHLRLLLTFMMQKQPPEVFYQKGGLKNFIKFAEKHLCQSLFLNKEKIDSCDGVFL